MNPLDIQIRERLLGYLNGGTDLHAFEDWFVPAAWDIEKSGACQALDLTYEVELLLAEYTNGHRSESDLREELCRLIPVYRGAFGTRSTIVASGTSQIIHSEALPFRWTEYTVTSAARW